MSYRRRRNLSYIPHVSILPKLRCDMFRKLGIQLQNNGTTYIWQTFIPSSIVTKLSYLIDDFGPTIKKTNILDGNGGQFLKDVLSACNLLYQTQCVHADHNNYDGI